MTKTKIYTRSWRLRKAYWTTFKVVMSYLRLYIVGKILGKKYYQKRITHLHLKNANRVKKAILELKGLFIKVGQLLSILTNFLPEAFQDPLEALQDQIPPRPFEEIRARIVKEFGKEPRELFEEFDQTAIASASIGQAHCAKLKDGTKVVVKVQHANIEKVASTDLEIMERLTQLISWFFDIKGIEFAYTQIRKMIEEELDFSKEAKSMQIISEELKSEERFVIPKVHEAFSTPHVLTTTFHQGVKINNIQQISKWNIDRTDLARRLVHVYCQMVFVNGHYHADPHPGNILIQQDGTIVLLDFGAVDTLQNSTREGLLHLIEGAAKNDSEKIIDALTKMGFIANERESERMAEKILDAFRNFLQNEVQFDGLNFQDIKVNPFQTEIFNLINNIGMKEIGNTVMVPKDYVLLNRMMTLLLGICNTLDNHMNPIDVVQPYFQQFILGEKGEMVKFVTNVLQQTIGNTLALPGDVRKLMKSLKRGEVEIEIKGHKQRTLLFYQLGQQLILSLLIIANIAFSFLFQQTADRQILKYFNWGIVLLGFLLFRSFWLAKKIKRRL